ncbi:hypothetical protein [Streptomyces sp. NPDC053560]|uniref:hypothetical protein n=1 Tax=Streptomyces sp. NPDC053560 TaxID=3365711 RepID=UPI0037CD0155
MNREFDALPADADERTARTRRADAARQRMLPGVRELFAEHPHLNTPHADAPRGKAFAKKTAGKGLRDLYSPAQLDVLQRLNAMLAQPPETERGSCPREFSQGLPDRPAGLTGLIDRPD